MRTVGQALQGFAFANHVDYQKLLTAKRQEWFVDLPDRYARLAEDVVLSLPEEWDNHATWEIGIADAEWLASFGRVDAADTYAGARRVETDDNEEGSDSQLWEVKLCPERIDGLSDAACRYLIAHELGHVASGLYPWSLKRFTRTVQTPLLIGGASKTTTPRSREANTG